MAPHLAARLIRRTEAGEGGQGRDLASSLVSVERLCTDTSPALRPWRFDPVGPSSMARSHRALARALRVAHRFVLAELDRLLECRDGPVDVALVARPSAPRLLAPPRRRARPPLKRPRSPRRCHLVAHRRPSCWPARITSSSWHARTCGAPLRRLPRAAIAGREVFCGSPVRQGRSPARTPRLPHAFPVRAPSRSASSSLPLGVPQLGARSEGEDGFVALEEDAQVVRSHGVAELPSRADSPDALPRDSYRFSCCRDCSPRWRCLAPRRGGMRLSRLRCRRGETARLPRSSPSSPGSAWRAA